MILLYNLNFIDHKKYHLTRNITSNRIATLRQRFMIESCSIKLSNLGDDTRICNCEPFSKPLRCTKFYFRNFLLFKSGICYTNLANSRYRGYFKSTANSWILYFCLYRCAISDAFFCKMLVSEALPNWLVLQNLL